MLNEIWMDIPHYDGLYQVSNLGRVKALPRERVNHVGGRWIQPEHIMATRLNNDGYECVSLTLPSGKRKTEKIHRLVAITFIPNPEGKEEVNHINCIRHDNRVENLEWMTRKENIDYTVKCGHKSNKLIRCIETGQIFNTSTEASKVNGGNAGNIRKAAKDRKTSVYGYHYEYIDKLSFQGITDVKE